jgi:hypothetical protein
MTKTPTALRRLATLALAAALLAAFTPAARATEPDKGPALRELETQAGKTIEQVNVPAVSPPKPVEGGAEVKKSSSTYEVDSSSAPAKAKKP